MPPYGAITLTVVVDATIDTFNQTAYIVGLAALLGNVPRSAIQLSVTAGSLVVRATVRVYSAAAYSSLMTRINSITPAQLAAATGSSVLTISGVTTTRLFPSPTLPPPAPRVPLERTDIASTVVIWAQLWWLLIALGIGVGVLLFGLWARWLCCTTSADEKSPATPTAEAPAPAPVDLAASMESDLAATGASREPRLAVHGPEGDEEAWVYDELSGDYYRRGDPLVDDDETTRRWQMAAMDLDYMPPATPRQEDLGSMKPSLPPVEAADATDVLAQFWYDGYMAGNADSAPLELGVAATQRTQTELRRLTGSPGSPVMRTPAPSSHPGRETFRAGRPRPLAALPPPAPANPPQPPEWVLDVTSPIEVTPVEESATGYTPTRSSAGSSAIERARAARQARLGGLQSRFQTSPLAAESCARSPVDHLMSRSMPSPSTSADDSMEPAVAHGSIAALGVKSHVKTLLQEAPGSIAALNEALVNAGDYMERVAPVSSLDGFVAPFSSLDGFVAPVSSLNGFVAPVSSLNVPTDEVQPRLLFFGNVTDTIRL